MPTGVTGVSRGPIAVPGSAAAMAGASSAHGGIAGPGSAVTRMPTGMSSASAMRSAGGIGPGSVVAPHPTGATFQSVATIPSIPGGFKASIYPHNPGAAGAFNFQNLPPPVKTPSPPAGDGGNATFVGAPTRGMDAETSPDHPAAAKSPPRGVGTPRSAPSSPKPPGSKISQTMKYALSTEELEAAVPKGKTLSDATIAESRGAALVDATRAFYGTHRPAYEIASVVTYLQYLLICWKSARNGLFGIYPQNTTRGWLP